MKIFDTLLGRTKPVRANLDALFSLPSAAVTMQVSAGLVPTDRAGVCFKPPAGQSFADVQTQIEELLRLPEEESADQAPTTTARVHDVADKYGYRWILVDGTGIEDLVTRVHMVHSSLQDAGWETQLLCSVFGFRHGDDSDDSGDTPPANLGHSSVYLVYLAKRGTFYPFVPTGREQRDTEMELRLKSTIGTDLPTEPELSRWFPLWDLPVS
ncbi:MAG: PspA-associated protein PspAB [Acidimicrobiales bacterium]